MHLEHTITHTGQDVIFPIAVPHPLLVHRILNWQVVVIPMRVNVNLKAVTVEDLIARRKVRFK